MCSVVTLVDLSELLVRAYSFVFICVCVLILRIYVVVAFTQPRQHNKPLELRIFDLSVLERTDPTKTTAAH